MATQNVKNEREDVREAEDDLRKAKKHGDNSDVKDAKQDLREEKEDLRKAKNKKQGKN